MTRKLAEAKIAQDIVAITLERDRFKCLYNQLVSATSQLQAKLRDYPPNTIFPPTTPKPMSTNDKIYEKLCQILDQVIQLNSHSLTGPQVSSVPRPPIGYKPKIGPPTFR